MVPQFVENFVHFKCGENRLDQDGCPYAALRDAQLFLRKHKNIVPQSRFEMALELRQVEIRSRSCRQQLFCVVKEIEAKIKKGTRHRLTVNQKMALVEMPAAGPHEQDCGLRVELVVLPGGRVGEGNGPPHGIDKVALPFDL